jgi:hypothetical protein
MPLISNTDFDLKETFSVTKKPNIQINDNFSFAPDLPVKEIGAVARGFMNRKK